MRWPIFLVSMLSCSPVAATSAPPSPITPVPVKPVGSAPSASASPAIVAPAALPFPTLATAGAKACSLRAATALGPHGEGNTKLAFRGTSGVAVWKRSKTELAVESIALDGAVRGALTIVPAAEGTEPYTIYTVEQGFTIVLRRSAFLHGTLTFWTLEVSADTSVLAPLADVGADEPPPPRTAPPPPDALTFSVMNGAVPPPPAPGRRGRIYEPMGQPILVRELGGKPVGETLDLESHGNSVSGGMHVDPYIVWSGTHFLYPFTADHGGPTHDTYDAMLLPVDCRP